MDLVEWVRVDGAPAEAARRNHYWGRGSAGGDGDSVVEDSGRSAAVASHNLELASLGTFSVGTMTCHQGTYYLVAAVVRRWADRIAPGSRILATAADLDENLGASS